MDDRQLATALRSELATRLGSERYELWFASQSALRVQAGRLTVRAASTFLCDWLRRSFADDLRTCWQAVAGRQEAIEFEVAETLANGAEQGAVVGQVSAGHLSPGPRLRGSSKVAAVVRTSPPAERSKPSAQARATGPTLAQFVMGPSNECAFRSAELTAHGRQLASPLLLVGPTGVGKTHLLRAMIAEFRRLHPRARALYLTAEQFTSSYVEAVRGTGLPSFRQKCRGAELLAMDDVHFFVGKTRTVEEFQYTLDTLVAEGRKLVLASDRNLAALGGLGPESVSRLAGGLVCQLEPPEFATRLAIVRQLCTELELTLEDDIGALVAARITAGARELRGALHQLQAMSGAWAQPIKRETAEAVLDELARQSARAVRLADVEQAVCAFFCVEPAELRSERKGRTLSQPRMLAMWLARKHTRAAWSDIGQFFGRRSHSTVISAHRRVEKLIGAGARIGVANQECDVEEAIRRLEQSLRTA
jgi:chromosomal replication initiator protein